MGNDGSGWSMSVWPRNASRLGQDTNDSPGGTKIKKQKRNKVAKRKNMTHESDAKKFELALASRIGLKAAKTYIRVQQRKKALNKAKAP